MARKIIRRFMPDPAFIRSHPSLQWLGKPLHDPNLWHLNRHSVAKAFFVGIFCAMLPVPFQMGIAAVFAMMFHSNLPLSVALVWITNPVTMPVIFYSAYRFGAWLLDFPRTKFRIELSWEWVTQGLIPIWEPLLAGSLIMGIVGGLLGYWTILLLWRLHVIRAWNIRRQKRIKRRLQQHYIETGVKKPFVPATRDAVIAVPANDNSGNQGGGPAA